MKFAKRYLSASGIVLTLDAVFTVPRKRVSRRLAKNDRGKFVRTVEEYDNLITGRLGGPSHLCEVRTDQLRVPYSHYITINDLQFGVAEA